MELRQIEHFLAVADELSFTRAAERVHVVQSALSASIAKLERDLGVTLFDRSRQRIRLTAAGETFRPQALRVLRASRDAADSVREFRGSLSGTIEFGSLISFGPVDVPRALGEFHREHPFVRLRLRLSQAGASAYLAQLIEGSLDLALVSMPNRFPPQLRLRLLFEEPMVFVCRPDHRLAAAPRIALGDLEGEELVGFPRGFGLRALMDDAFHSAGAQANTVYEAPGGYQAVADLVENGLGAAFMPVSEAGRRPSLRAVALAEPVLWQVYLVTPAPERMSPASVELSDALWQAAQRRRPHRWG